MTNYIFEQTPMIETIEDRCVTGHLNPGKERA
jgi:hypothetical protein